MLIVVVVVVDVVALRGGVGIHVLYHIFDFLRSGFKVAHYFVVVLLVFGKKAN